MREAMAMYLADRDQPCPGCGYNLRGLNSNRCPECDQELQLTVGLVEPKLGAWIAGMVGLACPLGFYLVFGIFGTVLWIRDPADVGWFGQVVLVFGGGTVGASVFLLIWIRQRRRFSTWSFGARLVAAAVAWLVAGIACLAGYLALAVL